MRAGAPVPRSWLFVPAHRERMVRGALASAADAVILDLEDAVPPAEKPQAREALAAALAIPATASSPARFVRVNAAAGGADAAAGADALDLDAAVRAGVAGIVAPKVEDAHTVQWLDAALTARERQHGLAPGTVALVPMIESPRALRRAAELAGASARVCALFFGGEDYRRELGLPLGRPTAGTRAALLHARAALVIEAAAAGVAAVDGVWSDLDDLDGLLAEAQEARGLGFAGKLAIHPKQLDAIHAAYRPTPEELAYAREVIAAFDAALAEGRGAVAFRGQMIEAPIVARARQVLARAGEHAGAG